MLNYIIRRAGYALVTLLFVAIVGFLIIELPPGSYLDFRLRELRTLGGDYSVDMIKALEQRYGVNDPVHVKFWKWFSNFVQGDFGWSFQYERDVGELLSARIGYTLMFTLTSLIVSWVISITVGVYSATHRYTLPDYAITLFQFIGLSVPGFLLALVLMIFAQRTLGMEVGGLFSSRFREAPWSWPKFVDLLGHLWIPIIVIGASGTAWLSRVMRGNLLDVLNMQYVQTARSKGLQERKVIWKHAVRNALHPLVMVFGMSFPAIISGETVISIVLNLPTAGPLFINALLQQDMYLAVTFLMFLAVLLVVGNLVADIVLAWLDPRIQFE
ncbi:MAG: ABC transporter permease [Anaerolineae bacterium]|jgi:peptide/nickel transport system permease protein|nr:ABC transporter permease [Anaerolineae bacterium]